MRAAWRTSTVGEVTTQCDYGLSCGLSVESNGVPILRMGNLQRGSVDVTDLKYVPEEEVAEKDYLQCGDLLLNRTNSAALVGKVGLFSLDAKMTFASYLFRLRVDKTIAHAAWLAQLLGSPAFQEKLRALATPGVSQTNINREVLRRLEVPLPPLTEQPWIAAILSSVDDAVEATQTVIDQLHVVKKAMMAELLTRGLPGRHTRFKQTEFGEVPEEWEVSRLEGCLSLLIDYRGKSPPKADHGAPLITAKNVRDGYINGEPREYIVLEQFDKWMSRGLPSPGDVLFTTEAPLGKAAAVPPERIALGQRLVTLCPDRARIDPAFFLWMLLGPQFQAMLWSKATGSTVQGIKQSVLRTLPVVVPPLEEQRAIGQLVQSVADREGTEHAYRSGLEHMKAALMGVLLSGEVRAAPEGIAF